LRHLSITVLRY